MGMRARVVVVEERDCSEARVLLCQWWCSWWLFEIHGFIDVFWLEVMEKARSKGWGGKSANEMSPFTSESR
jgi:hypothetical protein